MTRPELSAEAAPEFVDPASCKAWLDNVPLANVAAAQAELAAQIGEFNRLPTTPANRFAVMEHLREAVNFVQVEQAKRFSNRALPMLEPEADAFDATCALWQAMQAGYGRCRKLAEEQAADPHTGALVCQRMLAYIGLKMFHHHRAYREVPAADWRALHEAYARAERLGLAEEPVKDFLNRDVHDTSPRIAYARAVLMGTCNPNELTQRQLTFVAYLLERWAAKLEIARAPVNEGGGVPPLVADLASDRAPTREAATGPELRYLDARKLAKSLKNRVALLRQGESPARLALGEDCVQPSCEQLLVFLYRQWCQAKPARADRRKSAAGAEACNEFFAVHYHVSGRHFRPPGGEGDYRQPEPFLLERWRIEDESAQGLRLARPAGAMGKRYAHGQLVAVRPDDAKTFMLGQIRWLMAGADGVLRAGLQLLPGIPAGIAARPTGLNVQNEKYVPALALGAVAPLGAPTSLVLPSGWFKPKRVLELFAEAPLRVRLTEVLERGADFERIVYEPL